MLTSYETTLQSWFDAYSLWQSSTDQHGASFNYYHDRVNDFALELDTDPTLPFDGCTLAMLDGCCANYARNPSSENYAIMSGMMLYHQHKEFDRAEF